MMRKLKLSMHIISHCRSAIMGFAAVWIVLFHSSIPAPEGTLLRLIWYGIVGFGGGLGVNLFVLLSGYGLMFSHHKNSCCRSLSSAKHFMQHRLQRLLIPYVPVAGIYFAIRCILDGNGVVSWLLDITLISFFGGDRTYWYICAALIFYLLYPGYMKLAGRYGQGKVCAAADCFLVVLEFLLHEYMPAFYERIEILLLRAPLFFVGSYMGELAIRKEEEKKNTWAVCAALALAAVCFVIYGLLFLRQADSLRLQRYLFMPVSVGLAVLLAWCLPLLGRLGKGLGWLGKNSLGIYLIHIPLYELIHRVIAPDKFPYGICLATLVISAVAAEGLSRLVKIINGRWERKVS